MCLKCRVDNMRSCTRASFEECLGANFVASLKIDFKESSWRTLALLYASQFIAIMEAGKLHEVDTEEAYEALMKEELVLDCTAGWCIFRM